MTARANSPIASGCRARAASAAAYSRSRPGKASIAVWSPGLDALGQFAARPLALEALSKRMGWSMFGA